MDLLLYSKDLKELDEYMPDSEEERKNITVFLRLPMSCIATKKLEKIEKLFAPYTGLKRLAFLFEPKDYKISQEQLDTLIDFQVERPIDCCIEDEYDTCEIGKVYAAMQKIYQYCDFINKNDLSPVESLMYAYLMATEKPYKEEGKGEPEEISRSVFSIMNNDKIVCAGYCSIIKAIISNLNTENIKVFDNTTASYDENGDKLLHATLICYIKDAKYGIDGYYLLDPTVDSELTYHQDPKDRDWFVNNFLVTLGDIKYSSFEYKEVKYADMYITDTNELYSEESKHERLDNSLRFGDEKLLINKEFQKALNDNIKIIDELNKNYGSQVTGIPLSTTIHKNKRVVEEALYHNSEAIPLHVTIQSLYRIFNAMKLYSTKSENFYYTKKIINKNIIACKASENFKEGAANQISMCDDIYKV